ncbi:MAG: FG-GAP repeat domain-containing protein [Planctomycetota bacterium JB042]
MSRSLPTALQLGFTLLLTGLVADASGQFDNQWARFQNESATRLNGITANQLSNNDNEIDFDYADLDKNGFIDLVGVRKQPVTSFGKRTNVLLMNYNGVLTDMTTTFATASDVSGDQGFLTPTNDRDVEIADVNGDGWPDVITAPALSQGTEPKHIDHPRVYINLGESSPGNWNGLRFEDARFPQLIAAGGAMPGANSCGIAAGDVDNDGDADLYLVDYDAGNGGGANDLGDRLMINDGNGFFTDGSTAAMTSAMLSSAFGTAGYIADINGDGFNDVIKSENGPVDLRINNPFNPGVFNIFQSVYPGSAYHHTIGDLNADGRLDVAVGDDGLDRVIYNTGNDALGRPIWGPAMTFQFLAGGDDGFGNNNIIHDLDGDGWQDVVITDVDVDVGGCSRRTHIYRNPGGSVGQQITLREERQSAGSGWLGAVGFMQNDLTGGHDVVAFDIDNDGGDDIVLGRCSGTFIWMNKDFCAKPVAYASGELGSTGNVGTTTWSGASSVSGPGFTVVGEGFTPNSFAVLFTGIGQGNVPTSGFTIHIGQVLTRTLGQTDANGRVEFQVPISAGQVGFTRTFQVVVRDPGFGGNVQGGNAIQTVFCP